MCCASARAHALAQTREICEIHDDGSSEIRKSTRTAALAASARFVDVSSASFRRDLKASPIFLAGFSARIANSSD